LKKRLSIKAGLLTESGVTSVNYMWRSVMNQVYIIGRSAHSIVKGKVLKVIRETQGVKSIKDFIQVGG
jgi:hypothetical protein